ncbi:Cytochrome c oxidase, subunit VIa [Ophiocordyceps sinensis CO18]|uniref:Cytochrome c oxidase, subunit VIa n=1 Tax=Ophiocordyceps sinensis (strain Co18 / CGMCC 3.14243) TaxID=911162 RepID=T5AQR3_OPHSC|nr:Cytochrome c oxidase, subunit VIa [Ophiocordyceps sinensis CO18]
MFATRQTARTASRFAAQLRAPAQRRLASSSTENEFIKERQHIKDHASGTTVCLLVPDRAKPEVEIEDDLGNAAEHSREPMTNKGRSGVGPCLALAGANAYYLWNAHWEHWSHMPPLEERTEYPYQNIRTKNYQWGDGDKTIL